MISVLHGKTREAGAEGIDDGGFASLVPTDEDRPVPGRVDEARDANSWRKNVQLLLLCFFVSGVFTFATYFFPVLRNLPIFGSVAASTWLWTLNPSLAYVGQGIIMGPATTLHMLIGAVVGWGVLSPLAKYKGWASGSVDDWEHGSKGWIVWISLAIMLADSIVSLGHLALRSCLRYFPAVEDAWTTVVKTAFGLGSRQEYTSVWSQDDEDEDDDDEEKTQDDAPPEQQISDRIVGVGLVLSIVFCIACIHIVFGNLVPLYATVTAVFMALVLSIMGVRALGETDLNPVSGISKLAQLFFAFIIPQSNKSSVLINLVAGAVVCIPFGPHSGMYSLTNICGGSPRRYVLSAHQETETGKLTTVTGRPPSRRPHARPQDGASPRRGSQRPVLGPSHRCDRRCRRQRLHLPPLHIVRSISHTSPATTMGTDPQHSVYQVPGDLFQVPTGYVWIFTARLVTGEGLPPMAREWAMGAAGLFAVTTAVRIVAAGKKWHAMIPGGIAVAVGGCPFYRETVDINQVEELTDSARHVQRPVVHAGADDGRDSGVVVAVG